jgi:chemotaxis protein MotB
MSRKKPEKKSISQEWLTTYSDMMTLVLTFFVLLYSYSLVDISKFQKLAQSLSIAFGGTTGMVTNGGNIGPVPGEDNPGAEDENNNSKIDNVDSDKKSENEKMYEEVMKFIEEHNLTAEVTIREDTRGVLIELQESILFDSGKAEIKKESIGILSTISELLCTFDNNVLIEGHTDNRPISSGYYESNWELSADRAAKVLRYFTETRGMDGARFQVVGCGEYSPINTNDTAEGRQANRRVNILILSSYD